MITIYHNARCSKSRGALEILQEKGVYYEVRWYLTDPLSAEELEALLQKLSMQASNLVRKGEPYYKEHLKSNTLSELEWIPILTEHPELMERPIVVNGAKAIVARPPERVLDII